MNSKQKTAIILAVIGIIGGGGAGLSIAIDASTTITDNSETNISGDTVINVDGEGLTCEELRDSCAEANLEGSLKVVCKTLNLICPGN